MFKCLLWNHREELWLDLAGQDTFQTIAGSAQTVFTITVWKVKTSLCVLLIWNVTFY